MTEQVPETITDDDKFSISIYILAISAGDFAIDG
jgi:hypothetical protein